jgi:Spy/CpxP family protein refolding chaperone
VTRALIAIVGLSIVLSRATEAAGQAPAIGSNERAAAQNRIRERFVRLLRDRVGLSDDQLRRLAPVSRSFEARRQAIFRDERMARQSLRRELTAESADQARVAAHIDQLLLLQRRRLDLVAEEQQELAAFMTPVQRARYLALQEHLRRRAEEMRRRRGGGRRGPPGGSRGFE